MSTATYYVVRFYGNVSATDGGEGKSHLKGVVENLTGEQFPFHNMEELWDVFERDNKPAGRRTDVAGKDLR